MPVKLAEAGLIAIVLGCALGAAGRHFLRSRVRLTWSEALLAGIIGAILGAGAVNVLSGRADSPRTLPSAIGAVLGTVAVLFIVDALARRRSWLQRPAIELMGDGETSRVEFKSTARCNLHTCERDDKIEAVIVKTVAGFANAEGGCLLIGVDDDGKALGLDHDFKFMKAPDTDKYELFLRDLLGNQTGVVAAGRVGVDFARVDARDVCVLRVPPSPRPVFVTTPRDKRRIMYVRVGNSTRELELDEALAYCATRWDRRTIKRSGR